MKIGFDECFNVGPAQALICFLALEHPPIEAVFLPSIDGTGAKDDHWSNRLQAEGGWYVITGDRDKKKKSEHKRLADGPPLPAILPAKGISAVYLSGALQQSPGTERVRAVAATWPDSKKFFEKSAPGSRMLLTEVNGDFRLQQY